MNGLTTEQAEAGRARAAELREMTPEQRLDDSGIILGDDRREAVLHRLNTMPGSAIAGYIKAIDGSSRASAIKAHCLECMGYVFAEVANCTSPACTLYPFLKRND